ncbi:dephospho-CoA kinase [Thalassospiraceae bacterium LMO-JJ14]|nr:dephospho-CoA kinase [Thalassospiraceae bacterium LMO-JJ14]
MFILGLTGSIGMGKTVAAGDFRRLGLPVHDSDAAVHALMAKGGAAVDAVGAAFPGVVRDGAVDRAELGKRVFGDDQALKKLEAILHPMVRKQTNAFLGRHARLRTPAVVLDIPLLFETGAEDRCDAVCVVSAPYREQRRRVLARPGMTEEKFQEILKHQIPDYLKRRAADFVIFTGLGRSHSLPMIRRIATIVRTSAGTHWPPL